MKEFLSQRGVPYIEKRVDTDRQAAIEMVRRSGQQGVPVTIIGDEVIVGFDRPRLERALARSASTPTSTDKRALGAFVKNAADLALRGGTPLQGAYVGGVREGSPAERARLHQGDVIVAVDGVLIRTVDELSAALKNASAASTTLTVRRGTTQRDVKVDWE